jgi:hypothetical protein
LGCTHDVAACLWKEVPGALVFGTDDNDSQHLAHPTFDAGCPEIRTNAAVVLPQRYLPRRSHRFAWLTPRIGLFVQFVVVFVIVVVRLFIEILVIDFVVVLFVLIRALLRLGAHPLGPVARTIRDALLTCKHAGVTVTRIAKWETLAIKRPLFVRNRILRVCQDTLRTLCSMERAMDAGAQCA